jgi:hypothetical protein
MDVKRDTSPQFSVPFLPNLVTVFPSLSSSGKSHLVKQIIDHPSDYFTTPPSKVLVVLCNSQVDAFVNDDVPVILLQDFNPESDLEPDTLLIFEDVQTLTDKISTCINVYCHHLNLAGIFILVQGLLGRAQVFPLLTLSHRVVLFLQSTAVSRLANYILQFYQDQELRAYIKSILALAQRQEDIVLLEINKVRGPNQPFYVAIQGLDKFPVDSVKRPVVFPQPNKLHLYQEMNSDNFSESDDVDIPPGSFLLVPAENVTKRKAKGKAHDQDECQLLWNQTLDLIRENLENNFPRKKLMLAENLVREIMRTKQFCITKDGRTIMIKDSPKTKTPLLDLIANIVRQAGPNESPNPRYAMYAKILLQNGAPLVYFKNKSLLGRPTHRTFRKPTKSVSNYFLDG